MRGPAPLKFFRDKFPGYEYLFGKAGDFTVETREKMRNTAWTMDFLLEEKYGRARCEVGTTCMYFIFYITLVAR